ncbi:MAG: hypothetical protein N0E59_19005 [Candidatus Thiodiazotropha taylori]|nr:hypothetical protein [Candidatus Thiodiazotropha taylori]MCG8112850.1 hypothetical protein [Candidatus Thiodiazotropha taylori]MCW4285208.1 hypothetical protein [Candidatus Thiodiazotropha taylori]MCW4344880.1 hypothetical protein [Candidatus Thiodiazotropha endolucinida]
MVQKASRSDAAEQNIVEARASAWLRACLHYKVQMFSHVFISMVTSNFERGASDVIFISIENIGKNISIEL